MTSQKPTLRKSLRDAARAAVLAAKVHTPEIAALNAALSGDDGAPDTDRLARALRSFDWSFWEDRIFHGSNDDVRAAAEYIVKLYEDEPDGS